MSIYASFADVGNENPGCVRQLLDNSADNLGAPTSIDLAESAWGQAWCRLALETSDSVVMLSPGGATELAMKLLAWAQTKQ